MIIGDIHVEAAKASIKATEDVPVYDNRTGSLVEVGSLMKGETYTIESDYGPNWWQIRWGGHYGYIAKSATTQVSAVTYRNAVAPTKPLQIGVMNHDVSVMDNSTPNTLKQFAMLKQGQSYPIISHVGKWYGIELNGRLGYIYSDYVSIEEVKATAHTGILTATAEVVDLRREKPANIAHLYRNTAVQYEDDPKDPHYKTHVKIKWGEAPAYIARSTIKDQAVAAHEFTNAKPSTKFIIPYNSHNSEIHAKINGKLHAYGYLNSNQRYPLLRKEGEWYVTIIGGREGYIHQSKAAIDRGVPVLMYHHILPEAKLGFFKHKSTTVTHEQFIKEMAYLKSQNYETITLDDFYRYLNKQITLPANAVVITFDDGLLSTREYAYPILKKYNFKASQFLITARNDIANSKQVFSPNVLQALSWKDIENMSDVFSFEGHTHDLHNLMGKISNVLTVSTTQLTADLQRNYASLAKGQRAFAYPFGQFNATTVQTVKNAGFQMAFTTQEGYNSPFENPYEIKRVSSDQSVSLEQYKRLVRPF